MTHHHQPAPTTHTTELRQVQEINQRLAAPGHAGVTADTIGVAGMATAAASFPVGLAGTASPDTEALLPSATLRCLTAEGSPEFPYVLGHFTASPVAVRRKNDARLVIELHSDVLRQLSIKLGLRHCWGTDAVATGNSIR